MKIDFNENGMTINFDKVPKFLYFNEESKGCGKVFLDGVQRKGLQDIKIQAHTADDKGCHPLKYKIQYLEKECPGKPQYIGNMQEELCIGVRILDMEEFKHIIGCIKTILNDERIPEDIKTEYLKAMKLKDKLEDENHVK